MDSALQGFILFVSSFAQINEIQIQTKASVPNCHSQVTTLCTVRWSILDLISIWCLILLRVPKSPPGNNLIWEDGQLTRLTTHPSLSLSFSAASLNGVYTAPSNSIYTDVYIYSCDDGPQKLESPVCLEPNGTSRNSPCDGKNKLKLAQERMS